MRPVSFKEHSSNPESVGTFHQWGTAVDYHQEVPVAHTIAIVEMPNGKVNAVLPQFITFLDVKGY